ncbi:MAG: excinuclease ABC subunit UvrC [Ruminococcaceae bacterium]|nr:excinuclease ABC subunit UvrC [Oscillospiraceae bacterium]
MSDKVENFDIEAELAKLPEKPGVYLMHDKNGTVIYVGKAVVLKNRVKSYFRKNNHTERINQMISNIKYFEYIITDSEYEALMLECNLIKKYRPKYNVLLKDDKGYPYIRVSVQDDFPKMSLAHKPQKDGSKYYGPYFSSWVVNTTLDTLKNIFPLRTCDKTKMGVNGARPCLNYHIGLCPAPCAALIDKKEYRKTVDMACDFLAGKSENIVKQLRKEMNEKAASLEFEKAAVLREKVKALETVLEKQKITLSTNDDFDVAAVACLDIDACLQIFFVRGGRITGRDFFIFEGQGATDSAEIMTSFIKQFYGENSFIPSSFYSQNDMPESEISLMSEYMSACSGHKVKLIVPQRGERKAIADMAYDNAMLSLKNYVAKKNTESGSDLKVLEKLSEVTSLKRLPLRIEAYDISNQGNSEIDASMVVFDSGKPSKKEYKRFKIKGLAVRNDVASMEEVLDRRFARLVKGESGFEKMPDLLLIDGGIAQLGAAERVMEKYGVLVPVFGMVKDNHHRSRGLLASDGEEFRLEKDVDVWRFITAVQNEAHRFAIEYNRKLTEKRYRQSELDSIPKIGEKKKLLLLKALGSVNKIKKADLETLKNIKGLGESAAESVYGYFHKDEESKNVE